MASVEIMKKQSYSDIIYKLRDNCIVRYSEKLTDVNDKGFH